MKDDKLQELITLTCPTGHRLRGTANFIGKTVKCPRCQSAFVITPPESRAVTDTSVLRILGDAPVSDVPGENAEPKFRPCPRCSVSIRQEANVCEHCDCYVGVMPRFMTDMFDDRQVG